MKQRHLLLGGGLLLAGSLAFFGNREAAPDADLAQPLPRQAGGPSAPPQAQKAPQVPQAPARQATAAPAPAARASSELAILPLRDRAGPAGLERAGPAGPDREGLRGPGLFAALSWAPPALAVVAASGPPPPPTAPALPFRYLGRQVKAGQVEVFLAQGEVVHIGRANSLLDPLYRIDAISPTAISFTYLPLNLAQQLPLGASD